VCFLFSCYGHHLDLHSFPTRRSSDLMKRNLLVVGLLSLAALTGCAGAKIMTNPATTFPLDVSEAKPAFLFPVNLSHLGSGGDPRSEEHTSELQSRRDLVCRLLLEKKK